SLTSGAGGLLTINKLNTNSGVRLKLAQMMADRGVSLTHLAGRVGLTLANLPILKTNKARAVRFSTLASLCRELKCQPGDLLEFVEIGPQADTSSSGLPGDYY